jgi:hypothetical protein
MKRTTLLGLLVLGLLSHPARAQRVPQGFARLCTALAGSWTFEENHQTHTTTFEVVSHGQALLERNDGFIAVYHADGDHVRMTLYTRDGNQPRLHSADGLANGLAHFTFVDVTNLPAGGDHISGLTVLVKDHDHLVERWQFRHAGQDAPFEFRLTRKTGGNAVPARTR